MSSADISKGVNHRHNHQSKGQGNARMADGTLACLVDDDGSRAGKDHPEGAEEFREVFLHVWGVSTGLRGGQPPTCEAYVRQAVPVSSCHQAKKQHVMPPRMLRDATIRL